MLKINVIKFKVEIDEYLNQFGNFLLLSFSKILQKKNKDFKKNIILKDCLKNQSAYIIANGPSLNKFNLRKLKDHNLFFMNRGFLHKDYEFLKPKFHFIIDEKLNSGVWPIKFIDDIFKLNPDTKLFLNSKWSNNEKFKNYKIKFGDNIFWIDTRLFFTKFHKSRKINLEYITYGNAVSGAAFISSLYMGVNEVNLLGQDLNGLCYDIINEESHFYGNNEENRSKNIEDITDDLLSMSISIRNWTNMIKYSKNNNIKVVNLSDSSLLNLILKDD